MDPLPFLIAFIVFASLWLFAYATITTIVVDTKLGAAAFALLCGMAFVHAIGMGAVASMVGGPGWASYWVWFMLYFIGSIIAIVSV